MTRHARTVGGSICLLLLAGVARPTAAQEVQAGRADLEETAAIAREARASQTSLEEASVIAARLLMEQEDPVRAALLAVAEARAALEAIAPSQQVSESGEPDGAYEAALGRYAERVLALGRTPTPEVLGPLRVAVLDPDPRVRWAAVVALREGAASDPADPILQVVRGLVTADPIPGIRRAAFETYCRWGDQDAVMDLAMALGRATGPVQDLAVREWIRIERELLEAGEADLQVELAEEEAP